MKPSLNTFLPCLALLMASTLCVTDAMAQGPGGRGGRQGGGPNRGGANANPQQLLRNEDVQRELEMTEDQIEQLEQFNEGRGRDRGGDRGAMRAEMEGLSDEARAEKFREMRESRTSEQMAALEDVLLPHQMKRLTQIAAQASAQGGTRAFTNGSLAEKLGITDEQKERIEKKAEELQKELNEEIAKLRADVQAKLMKELTPEQQAQYKELTGEKFTFQTRQRGGDRGGAGGPGGNRGGAGGRAGGQRGGAGGQRGGAGGRARGERGGRGGGRGGERGGDRNSDGDA